MKNKTPVVATHGSGPPIAGGLVPAPRILIRPGSLITFKVMTPHGQNNQKPDTSNVESR